MKNIQETECVLQKAYDIDIGKTHGLIDPNEVLSRIGVRIRYCTEALIVIYKEHYGKT